MREKHLLQPLLLFVLSTTVSTQLSCHRIPTSFCCTTRIRDQCPEQCATVQCGTEFIHNCEFFANSRLTAHVNQPLSVVLMMGMRILEAREVEIHREDSKVLVSFFSYRQYRTTEKNILGSGWLTDSNYKNFSIVPEETEFAEKLKENVLKKIKYVYDQRVLYCEEIAEIPYEEYKEFGHDIFNCTFRNEAASNKSVD
ncbi:hypothetical protein CRE_12363 [Caenorhabditis remanei]|uniref:Uncharacterized protein n=1 Tax=Caenorhabditis remanei TaxID=31234 RepID=E3NLW7_CAERE|nr:hypothetical protein CRE_12363 [Caenorhabditis remanei]